MENEQKKVHTAAILSHSSHVALRGEVYGNKYVTKGLSHHPFPHASPPAAPKAPPMASRLLSAALVATSVPTKQRQRLAHKIKRPANEHWRMPYPARHHGQRLLEGRRDHGLRSGHG